MIYMLDKKVHLWNPIWPGCTVQAPFVISSSFQKSYKQGFQKPTYFNFIDSSKKSSCLSTTLPNFPASYPNTFPGGRGKQTGMEKIGSTDISWNILSLYIFKSLLFANTPYSQKSSAYKLVIEMLIIYKQRAVYLG